MRSDDMPLEEVLRYSIRRIALATPLDGEVGDEYDKASGAIDRLLRLRSGEKPISNPDLVRDDAGYATVMLLLLYVVAPLALGAAAIGLCVWLGWPA
jgi:hypothetical protein